MLLTRGYLLKAAIGKVGLRLRKPIGATPLRLGGQCRGRAGPACAVQH